MKTKKIKTLREIKGALIKHREELSDKFGVKEIGVFGSYARREQCKNSDVDILVEFSEVPGLFKFIEMENLLSKITGVKVDLVMKAALKPTIGQHILNEVIYL